MVYSNDQWVLLPTKDIYDTNIMLASINAARDMYEKGVKLIEDFNKNYGDFITSISKDLDWYDKNVTGKVRDTINDLYAQGIDPTRSAEGRAAISKLIYSMPTGIINLMRANAANYQEWLKNRAELQAKNLYLKEYDDFVSRMNNLPTADEFSTVGEGGRLNSFNTLSPAPLVTMLDIIDPLVDNIKPGLLNKAQVESFKNMHYDPKYEYEGVSGDMLDEAIEAGLPGISSTIPYHFYRDQAKLQLIMEGNSDPSMLQINARFLENARNSVRERLLTPTRKADEYARLSALAAKEVSVYSQKSAIDNYYKMLEGGADLDGDGNISRQERIDYYQSLGNKNRKNPLFDWAEDLYTRNLAKLFNIKPEQVSEPNNAKKIGKVIYNRQSKILYSKNNRTSGGNTYDSNKVIDRIATTNTNVGELAGWIAGQGASSDVAGEFTLSDNIVARLHSADYVLGNAAGSGKFQKYIKDSKPEIRLIGRGVDESDINKSRATGRTFSLLMKSGKIKTWAEIEKNGQFYYYDMNINGDQGTTKYISSSKDDKSFLEILYSRDDSDLGANLRLTEPYGGKPRVTSSVVTGTN